MNLTRNATVLQHTSTIDSKPNLIVEEIKEMQAQRRGGCLLKIWAGIHEKLTRNIIHEELIQNMN